LPSQLSAQPNASERCGNSSSGKVKVRGSKVRWRRRRRRESRLPSFFDIRIGDDGALFLRKL